MSGGVRIVNGRVLGQTEPVGRVSLRARRSRVSRRYACVPISDIVKNAHFLGWPRGPDVASRLLKNTS